MIITSQFKQIYKNFINEIISSHGLSNSCILRFNNGSSDLCPNCIYDILNKCSLNKYNGSGPEPFMNNTICPVCMGIGSKKNNNKVKKLYMSIIMESKYFMNMDSKVVNIPDGSIQTICHKDHVLDIRNANALVIENIPDISYERVQDVNYAGLGDLDYIVTNWKRQ